MTWRHSLPINPDSPTPLVDGTELKGFWLDDRWRCYSEDVATPTESLHQLHRNIITVASTRGYFIPTHFILHSSFWTKKIVIRYRISIEFQHPTMNLHIQMIWKKVIWFGEESADKRGVSDAAHRPRDWSRASDSCRPLTPRNGEINWLTQANMVCVRISVTSSMRWQLEFEWFTGRRMAFSCGQCCFCSEQKLNKSMKQKNRGEKSQIIGEGKRAVWK